MQLQREKIDSTNWRWQYKYCYLRRYKVDESRPILLKMAAGYFDNIKEYFRQHWVQHWREYLPFVGEWKAITLRFPTSLLLNGLFAHSLFQFRSHSALSIAFVLWVNRFTLNTVQMFYIMQLCRLFHRVLDLSCFCCNLLNKLRIYCSVYFKCNLS